MKNVLITGVSGGIGKGVAEHLLASGSTVIGLDRTIRDEIRETAEQYPGGCPRLAGGGLCAEGFCPVAV